MIRKKFDKKTASAVVGEYKPTPALAVCLNCTLPVAKCKGLKNCVDKQNERKLLNK